MKYPALLLAVLFFGCGSSTPSAQTVDSGAIVEETAVDSASVEDAAVDAAAEIAVDASACGCAAYGEPAKAGTIVNTELTELSGLARSALTPGVLFAHNDSGDTPRIFPIDEIGASLGEISVGGATAVDWEDIASGPCPAGHCLFVGDIGNNSGTRTDLAIYRFAEPKPDAKTVTAEKFPLSYTEGSFNAETLLVDPMTGEILVVVKGTHAYVYRLPAAAIAGTPSVMEKVGEAMGLDGVVTAGAVSPCGDRVLLRTYTSLYEYRGANAQAALASTPVKVPVAKEPQGEAVEYRADGKGYFTASEGKSLPLSVVSCK